MTVTGKFTAVGTGLWDWEPFLALDANGRCVWMALYTCADSKRIVPGLWHGGIYQLADVAHMRPDDVQRGIDDMLKAEEPMVEYDQAKRIIRLTMFPDAHEKPTNGDHLKGWWNRFLTVPQCGVRDAHVRTLRWLVDQTACTQSIEEAWAKTFGSVRVPAPRRRGVRRLGEPQVDNETAVQQNLFAPRPTAPAVPIVSSPPVVADPTPSGASSLPSSPIGEEGYPHLNRITANSGNLNEIKNSGQGVDPGVRHPQGEGKGEGYVFSSSPDSGRGGLGEGTTSALPDSGAPPPPRHLTLVPPTALVPLTVAALVMAATGRATHRDLTPELESALENAVAIVSRDGVTAHDMEFVRFARGGRIPSRDRIIRWIADPINIRHAIECGRLLQQEANDRRKALAEVRAEHGM